MRRRKSRLEKIPREEINIPKTNDIKAIDDCRASLGVTQKFFGPAIGIYPATYSSYVRHGVSLTREEFKKAMSILTVLRDIYYGTIIITHQKESEPAELIRLKDTPTQLSNISEVLKLIGVTYDLVDGAKYSPRKAAVKELLKLIKVKINENN